MYFGIKWNETRLDIKVLHRYVHAHTYDDDDYFDTTNILY